MIATLLIPVAVGIAMLPLAIPDQPAWLTYAQTLACLLLVGGAGAAGLLLCFAL